MQALLEHFITQSTVYSLIAVVLVAFLESLALVGLILPGTVLMAGLGGADWQWRVKFLARTAGRDRRLPAGRLDLFLAGLAF